MDANRLTEKAQEAIAAAQRLAEERRHTQLEPEHLLYALVNQENGVVPACSRALVSRRVRSPAPRADDPGFAHAPRVRTQVYVSNRFRRVFDAPRTEPTSSRTISSPPSTSCWR